MLKCNVKSFRAGLPLFLDVLPVFLCVKQEGTYHMSPTPHLCQDIIRTSGRIDFAAQVRFQEEVATAGHISCSLNT